jgi:hypothetical protein
MGQEATPEPTPGPSAEDGTAPATTGGRTFTIVVVAVSLVVLAAATAGVLVVARGGHDEPAMRVAPGGVVDLAEVPEHISAHYRFAAEHPHAYRAVPCFCGCDATLEHRFLLDCFVRASDGRWEAHASGCAVCIRESEIIRSMLAEGASIGQIRAEVIGRYTMDV